MRLKHLKFLKILNRAGKRVVSLLGAVALIALNVVPALASHVPEAPTSEYINFYPDDKNIECSSIDDIYNSISFDFFPFTTYSSNYSHYNMDDVENWLSNHSNINEIVFYMQNKSGDISINSFIYDVDEITVNYDGSNIIMNYLTSDTVNFVISGLPSFVKSDSGYTSTLSYAPYTSLGNLTTSTIYKYPNNANYTPLKLISSNLDIYDASGNIAIEKEVTPEAWLYDVSYSPVLADELSDLQYIDVTVSLQEAFIKYLEKSDYLYRFDFLPYIAETSASDNLAQSYDYAYAVSPYRGTYYDKYTVQAGSWGNNHLIGYNKDNCLGTSIVYTLNSANNYSATVRISIPDTSLVSGNQYYFNVVGIMSSNLWYKTADSSSPNRALFRQLYDDYSSGNLSDWSDDGLQSFRVIDSTAFTMSSVLKKTSKNYNVDGGLMSNTTNALNSNPSIIKDVAGSGNDLAFSEVEDYNNQQAEDYVESAPDKELSGFSLSGLLSTLKYSDEFLGFLSYGFSILPIQIWSLIKFSIVAVCFVGIVKTAVHQ